MFIFCTSCASQFEAEAFLPSCIECGSERLSTKILDFDKYYNSSNDIHQIGIVSPLADGLVWSEFAGNTTYVQFLPRNFAIAPTIAYDITTNTVIDPINETEIRLPL